MEECRRTLKANAKANAKAKAKAKAKLLKRLKKNRVDYGLTIPKWIRKTILYDLKMIVDHRFIAILPARITVDAILHGYSTKYNVSKETLHIVKRSFHCTLRQWSLYKVELLKNNQMLERYPNTPIYEIYGLPHLLRYITRLPKLFKLWGNIEGDFVQNIIDFTNGLIKYLEEEQFPLNIEDYENIMPDYWRMSNM